MWDTIRKLRNILDAREQRRSLILLGMILFMGLIESSRVASVLPFVAVLATPEIVETNIYLNAAYNWLGFTSINQFLMFLGVALFVILLITLSLSALLSYATTRFTSMRTYSLSRRLFASYLDRRYEFFLGRNSSDLSKSVLGEVNQVVGGSLMPLISLATDTVMAACMIGLLLLADPLLAILVTGLLGGGYWLVFFGAKRHLSRIGDERLAANRERFRASAEAFHGIKDLKVLGLEQVFMRRFDVPSRRIMQLQVHASLIGSLPSYGFQAVAFGVVLLIVAYQMTVAGDLAAALPIVALYALAGQRLMPALQGIYKSSSQLRFSKAALDTVYADISEAKHTRAKRRKVVPLGLRHEIALRNVTYNYPTGSRPALNGVTLSIPALSTVGIVGQTGAGKTTLVDIILGLLDPQSGELVVDGATMGADNGRAWLASIGYVPQHIFLSDDTLAANIAFGVTDEDIDMEAVKRAAGVANLGGFVEQDLPLGYQTVIGERGTRLSGGQRQRVGIARALYRDPDLLIMDEGTSALDNLTEAAVMEAVSNIAKRKTIIMIAHRLTTVRKCDVIYMLDRGVVVAEGTYDQLVEGNDTFRAMARGSS